MVEENKALISRLYDELFVQWNFAVVDELFSPDFVAHDLPAGTPPGPEGIHQWYTQLRINLPGAYLFVEDIIGEGDKVMVRWTGRNVPATGIALYRINLGKIVERWVEVTFHQV